ncbi:hypothetical protein LCGC14_2458390 [marine sediment metagenome]|uniref:Uncharacterized protein n=1 Tax=marine sediment metagenome TaxID=412755 RepID=A0A0F9DR50_9ZZZZ
MASKKIRAIENMPSGIADKYEYRGYDGGNELMPESSGHYWMNGYAMWRPSKRGEDIENSNVKAKKVRGKWVWIEFIKVK